MAYHAFVAMPFGVKKGFDGKDVDFNLVYRDLIRPALEDAGFRAFRADEETRGGDIKSDMFQELLISDLVVADLSLDNPNVWYELGVRHALRARGVVLIQADRPYQPFDVFTDRKLRYHLKDGAPDPAFLSQDRAALARMATDTMAAWHGRPASPVYQLLPNLKVPDWKSLRMGSVVEFWEAYEKWTTRIKVARQRGRPGDIMVLAEEGATRIFRMEAHRRAGAELRAAGQPKFALEQYDKALAIEPLDLDSRRQRGMLLGRLGRHDEAMACFQAILGDFPGDAETFAYVGRLEKDVWTADWRAPGKSVPEMRQAAADGEAWLRRSIDWYAKGFAAQPSHYYSGVNAVTLAHLLRELTGDTLADVDAESMAGAVRWAARSAASREEVKFWPLVTLGDLELLVGARPAVERAYRDAIAAAEKDWFALSSSREQLLLLRDLGFRTEVTGVAIGLFDRALDKLQKPAWGFKPERVLLFSGHMIDAKGRPEPRFPADKEPVAAKAIDAELDRLKAGPQDLGFCGGACGGDILFAEAMLQRGARMDVRIPFPESQFFQRSVSFEKAGAGTPDTWKDRFDAVKANPLTSLMVMPDELGPTPPGRDDYERLNLWQLYSALAHGPEKVHAVLLWNRQGGDGPGGTRHMHDEVSRRTGQVHVLDTRKLWS